MAAAAKTVRILSETEFEDRTDPAAPRDKVLVTYILEDGRVGSVQMGPYGANVGQRNEAIVEDVRKRFGLEKDVEIGIVPA